MKKIGSFILLLLSGLLAHSQPLISDTVTVGEEVYRVFSKNNTTIVGKPQKSGNENVEVSVNKKKLDPKADSVLHEGLCRLFYAIANPSATIRITSSSGNTCKYFRFNGEVFFGEYKEFYTDGKIKVQGNYDDSGKKIGIWRFYSRSGKLRKTKTYS
jgi:antitoxin component YwqK of YwqJK toxin-antitoxin module